MNQQICSLTEDLLDDVARIHLKAFPGRALSLLGAESVRRYYEWQLLGPHDAVALGIFAEDHLAGFCFAGVFRGALSGFLQKNKRYLFWQVFTHPWLITNPLFRARLNLAQSVFHRLKSTPPAKPTKRLPSFGILSIAIDPIYQGKGLGKRLSEETEAIAIERGFDRMHLTVDIDNAQAISFYEKTGWIKEANPPKKWNGRMTKDLSNQKQS